MNQPPPPMAIYHPMVNGNTVLMNPQYNATQWPTMETNVLPPGWQSARDTSGERRTSFLILSISSLEKIWRVCDIEISLGRTYYIDHNTKTTSYVPPAVKPAPPMGDFVPYYQQYPSGVSQYPNQQFPSQQQYPNQPQPYPNQSVSQYPSQNVQYGLPYGVQQQYPSQQQYPNQPPNNSQYQPQPQYPPQQQQYPSDPSFTYPNTTQYPPAQRYSSQYGEQTQPEAQQPQISPLTYQDLAPQVRTEVPLSSGKATVI
jgi:hypothetical protein